MASDKPGQSPSRPDWGILPLLVDTSAWARASHPSVREPWTEALLSDRLRLSTIARLEILLSARDAARFDALVERLDAIRGAQVTPTAVKSAERAMQSLSRRSAGSHRLPVVDYLLAATAEDLGAAVLHYDRDFDTLAGVMSFDSIWLAPPGSLP
jgi:predicted nucleic acid-binding protein